MMTIHRRFHISQVYLRNILKGRSIRACPGRIAFALLRSALQLRPKGLSLSIFRMNDHNFIGSTSYRRKTLYIACGKVGGFQPPDRREFRRNMRYLPLYVGSALHFAGIKQHVDIIILGSRRMFCDIGHT